MDEHSNELKNYSTKWPYVLKASKSRQRRQAQEHGDLWVLTTPFFVLVRKQPFPSITWGVGTGTHIAAWALPA